VLELAERPQNAILLSSKVTVEPLPNPLPIRWGEGKDLGVGRVHPSGIDYRKSKLNVAFCDGHVERLTVNELFFDNDPAWLRKCSKDHEPHIWWK